MTASKMTVNGVSVCATGQENYERFEAKRGKWYYQYDYRHTDGELFSVVLPTIEECKERRDKWLADKLLRGSKRQAIIQGDKTILISEDGISVAMIFKNLIGENPAIKDYYQDYIRNIAIPQMGFGYGKIELLADGVTVRTGEIRKKL